MAERLTLTPSLKVLMPELMRRCVAMQRRMTKPKKAEQVEEVQLLATISVRIDLITQGWSIVSTDPLVIDFPDSITPEDEKARIRQAHLIDRDSQITEPSVKEFIEGMEKRRLTARGWHSDILRDA